MTTTPNSEHPEVLLGRLGRGKQLSRRQFMTLLGAVAAGEFAAAQLGPLRRVFASGTAGGSASGITVFLYLGGGNDGLNTVVPLSSNEYNRYVSIRTKTIGGVTSSIAYPAPGTPNRPDALRVGDADIGFNPGMANISQWYRDGKVAVIQGVGYSNANFSHFESQEHWWGGTGAAGSPVSYKAPSGWLGRFADTAGLSSMGAISINGGGSLNPSLRSMTADALAISPWQGNRLGASTSTRDQRAAVAVRAMTQQTNLGPLGNDWSKLGGSALDLAPVVSNAYAGIVSGSSGLKRQLTMAANLIGADLGTRVIHTDTGGFDTHENQRKANTSGVEWHTGLWMDIDDSLNAFFSLLSPANRRRVNVVVYSEFGRRVEMNGTYGTDHGAGSVALVMGDNVKGGRYGEYPSLFDLRDPETGGGGNLKSSVDFRQVYSTILQGWLGVDAAPIIGAVHAPLAFIAAAPGDVVGATTTTSTSTSTSSSTSSSTTSSSSTSSSTSTTPTTTIAPATSTIVTTTSPTTVPNPTTSIVTTTIATATTVPPTVATSTVPPTVATSTVPPTVATTTVAPTAAPTTPPTMPPAVATTVVQTTVPATTIAPITTTSTTTTTVDPRRPVPPNPATTPTKATPDSVNTTTQTVVPPAPAPAEAAEPTTTIPAATTTTGPAESAPSTPAPSATTTTSTPTSTVAPATPRATTPVKRPKGRKVKALGVPNQPNQPTQPNELAFTDAAAPTTTIRRRKRKATATAPKLQRLRSR